MNTDTADTLSFVSHVPIEGSYRDVAPLPALARPTKRARASSPSSTGPPAFQPHSAKSKLAKEASPTPSPRSSTARPIHNAFDRCAAYTTLLSSISNII
jgi:hypothetical protein